MGSFDLLLFHSVGDKMLQQAIDFKEESDALFNLLKDQEGKIFQKKTQFKGWTINNVLHHLHVWNVAADMSLVRDEKIMKFLEDFFNAVNKGYNPRQYEKELSNDKTGKDLLCLWKESYEQMTENFKNSDPKKRVKWAGPDMSVISSITARLMETWSHGQEVYDMIGVKRVETDRIKNIVIIGINTFGWTFINRSQDVPGEVPNITLKSPSGEIWEWNPENKENKILGNATDFCQVVTQVRNIDDTNLLVEGEVAQLWMSIAQCFAGPPEDPPLKGTRFTHNG